MYGYRKIVIGLVLLSVGVAITLIKGDIPPHLQSLMESLFLYFVMGNSAGKFTQLIAPRKEVKNEKVTN